MKHLYRNSDGETVAADSLEEAARHHDCELGDEPEPQLEDWHQIPDEKVLRFSEEGKQKTMRAVYLAMDSATVELVLTTY